MKGCPTCDGQKVVDPAFLGETQKVLAELTADLITFCREKKIDYHQLPILQKVAACIRSIESL
jgi:hypothetical protein